MEKRVLGRTGESLSIVGFGGIVVVDEEPSRRAVWSPRRKLEEDEVRPWPKCWYVPAGS